MTAPRHRAEPARVRWRSVLGAAAVSVTCAGSAVGAGVQGPAALVDASGAGQSLAAPLGRPAESPVAPGPAAPAAAAQLADLDRLRQLDVSRSGQRSRTAPAVTLRPRAVGHRWATAPLNVWTGPGEQSRRSGLLPARTRLRVTGQVSGHWAEVLLGERDRVRWVNADYLAKQKPEPPEPPESPESPATSSASVSSSSTTSGISTAPCADGSSIESGLTASATAMYRAVCAAFPALEVYGGYDNHGEHVDGRAIDFMTYGDSALGSAVAEYLRANAGVLRVRDIIYAQRIWTPEQASAGWRGMSDRGSVTANHYDHVHAAVF